MLPGPLVSIVIPVYNGSNYLKKAIDSALKQTYPHIEIIVVNDGSDDKGRTEAIARTYGGNIRYFKKKNGGVASALNVGIEEMRGKYFSWLSHDDEYLPKKLEYQVKKIEENLSQPVILFSDHYVIDNFSRRVGVSIVCPRNLRDSLSPIVYGFINGCTLLIPKECFARLGNFNENLPMTQDYDLWFRLARHYPFIHQPNLTVLSRRHLEQGSNESDSYSSSCDEVYVKMLESLSDLEIARIEKNRSTFYVKVKIWLKMNHFGQALNVLEHRFRDLSASKSKVMINLKYIYFHHIYTLWLNHYNFLGIFFSPICSFRKIIGKLGL